MRALLAPLIVLAMLAPGANARAASASDIAPTGALRVAIGVGPAASAFWATRDPATGKPRGVTVELAKAAAERLGVPLALVEYQNSGEITAAASKDAWDISFMPQDAEREKFVDPGPAFVIYESSYLVRAGSDIRNAAEVDRAGIRVGGVEGTSTSRTVARSLKLATLSLYPKPDLAAALLGEGKLDALAMGRESLIDFSKKMPGTRLLDEVIQSTGVVVVVPKNRAATRDWAARFIEVAKKDGTVRRALDSAGFVNAAVAPTEIRLWTARAITTVLGEVGPQFERATGYKLSIRTDLAQPFVTSANAGEPFDLMITGAAPLDGLIAAGRIDAASRTEIARSGIGVEVRSGAAKPDVGSVEAFKRALLAAKSIAYLKDVGSGIHVARVIDRLGIADDVRSKVTRPDSDIVSELVARGEVELGMVVITQILTTPGVELVGPLPAELQSYVAFTAGVGASAKAPEAAKELIRFLTGPIATPVIKAQGMEPRSP